MTSTTKTSFGPTPDPSSSGTNKQSGSERDRTTELDSREIQVDLYHQVICFPFRLEQVGKSADPDTSQLDQWVSKIVETDEKWVEEDQHLPFEGIRTGSDSDCRSWDNTYARTRYAEFVYFHPYVRSFLYPSVEDRFMAGITEEGHVKNRSIRMLKRDNIRWVEIKVLDHAENDLRKLNEVPHEKPASKTFQLRVRRMELHLFETQIGFLVVELDNQLGPNSTPSIWKDYSQSEGASGEITRPVDIALGNVTDWGENIPSSDQGKRLTLHDVLLLQDTLRRGFIPYWEFDPLRLRVPDGSCCSAGHVVQSFRWLDKNFLPVWLRDLNKSSSDPTTWSNWSDDFNARIQQTTETGMPSVFPWWKGLLGCMYHLDGELTGTRTRSFEEQWLEESIDEATPKAEPFELCYQEFGDDRFPCMTYIAVKEPWKISRGDWMRLGYADLPGNSLNPPYSPWLQTGRRDSDFQQAFQSEYEQFCQKYALDRFFYTLPEEDGRRDNPSQKYLSTRFINTGLVFVAVGCSDPEAGRRVHFEGGKELLVKPFGIDPVSGLLGHFRYHYFKVGLIALFHRYSLLNFENELSIAVSKELGKPFRADVYHSPEFTRLVVITRKKLIRFRLRFWFSEITPQQQGQELFELWSHHLKTRPLFEGVNNQVDEAEELLARWDAEAQTKSEASIKASLTLFAIIGIPLGFMNLASLLAPNLSSWGIIIYAIIMCVWIPILPLKEIFSHAFSRKKHWIRNPRFIAGTILMIVTTLLLPWISTFSVNEFPSALKFLIQNSSEVN